MIDVLLVDDEALTLELHRNYVERLEGFRVAGECSSARAAATALMQPASDRPVDLVLLDMTMPDGTGLDVLRHVRARGVDVDVIAVTGVRDAEVVRQMAGLGVASYLVKPFTFQTFRERMEQYAQYREQSRQTTGPATQGEIDAMFQALRPTGAIRVPKGLSAETLARITDDARVHQAVSARETAERIGVSRVAARRYLEHLADAGRVVRAARHGTPGRPETEYRWR